MGVAPSSPSTSASAKPAGSVGTRKPVEKPHLTEAKTVAPTLKARLSSGKQLLDLQNGHLKTGATFDLRNARQVTIEHERPGNAIATRFSSTNWSATYQLHNKDLRVLYHPKFRHGEWTIKQKIPGGNWALFPSPAIQAKFRPLQTSSVRDSLHVSYSYQTRIGALREEVQLCSGRLELHGTIDSKTGISGADVTVVCKPQDMPYAKQLGVHYSQAGGPRLSWKAAPTKNLTVTSALNAHTQSLKSTFELQRSEGTMLTVNSKISAKELRPTFAVGIKTNF